MKISYNTKLGTIVGLNQLVVGAKPVSYTKKLLVDPWTHIGLEIEIENFISEPGKHLSAIEFAFWEMTNDPSLRGSNSFELRHRVPLHSNRLVKSINVLGAWFDRNSNTGNFSCRCSMHCHINVLDMLYAQFLYFILLYTTLEKTIYKYCSYNRYNNGYCVPIFISEEQIETISQLFSFHNRNIGSVSFGYSVKEILLSYHKYAGINLGSIANRGSIEFRMHPGTRNKSEIYDFINILTSIKKFAVEHGTEENINNFYREFLEVGPHSFLTSIYRRPSLLKKLLYDGIYDDIINGATTAQDFVMIEHLRNSVFNISSIG